MSMQNELVKKQLLMNSPEKADFVKNRSLVPVSETEVTVCEAPMNTGRLVRLFEAIRRVFPSKEKLTLSKIKHFLRVEGFVPMQNGEDGISFKIQGETFRILYDGLRLCFMTSYELPKEGLSVKALKAANDKVASDVYGVKSCLVKGEGCCTLRFTAESICGTYVDFARQYNYYMGAIDHSVCYHHNVYGSFLEQYPVDSDEEQTKRRRIGFLPGNDDLDAAKKASL